MPTPLLHRRCTPPAPKQPACSSTHPTPPTPRGAAPPTGPPGAQSPAGRAAAPFRESLPGTRTRARRECAQCRARRLQGHGCARRRSRCMHAADSVCASRPGGALQHPRASPCLPRTPTPASPVSLTNWPTTVLSPPASLAKVTSAEKAVSSSTRPHCTQHLFGSKGAGGGGVDVGGVGGGDGTWRRRQAHRRRTTLAPPQPHVLVMKAPCRCLPGPQDSRKAVRVVHLHVHFLCAVVAVHHGCCPPCRSSRASGRRSPRAAPPLKLRPSLGRPRYRVPPSDDLSTASVSQTQKAARRASAWAESKCCLACRGGELSTKMLFHDLQLTSY